jgi:hypothetical protein
LFGTTQSCSMPTLNLKQLLLVSMSGKDNSSTDSVKSSCCVYGSLRCGPSVVIGSVFIPILLVLVTTEHTADDNTWTASDAAVDTTTAFNTFNAAVVLARLFGMRNVTYFTGIQEEDEEGGCSSQRNRCKKRRMEEQVKIINDSNKENKCDQKRISKFLYAGHSFLTWKSMTL